MKKLNITSFMIALAGILFLFSSCSNDDNSETGTDDGVAIAYEKLPDATKQFVSDHFADYQVSKSVQKTAGYQVVLSNTSTRYEIEFDLYGEWIEIESINDAALPDNVLALLPRAILSYVAQNYSGKSIKQVDKESYGYKVELTGNSDIELMFDTDGGYLAKDADNDITVDIDQLPSAVLEFLSSHFSTLTIKKITKDADSYDVEYTNETEVKFNLSGNWTEVDVEGMQMPASVMALLPQAVNDYLTANYPSRTVETVKNKTSTYVVELNGDIDLIFDKEGNLWSNNSNNNSSGSGTNTGNRIELESLPQNAQTVLNTYFLINATYLYGELDDEYEVKLSDGTDLEFHLDGSLKSAEVLPGNEVPVGVMPETVVSYVRSRYADRKIEEFEVKSLGYKVELSGYPEIELLFDKNGNFKGVD